MTRWKDTLPPLTTVEPELSAAAFHLVAALRDTTGGFRDHHSLIAAAHIRAVRKQIEAEHGIGSDRQKCLPELVRDDALLWYALQHTATAGRLLTHDQELAAYFLRCAEAALRTLWHRGQS